MEKEFKIAGMSCGHCVMAVEKELNKLDIVKKKVKLGSAKIEFNPDILTEDRIIDAINKAGYLVTI